MNESDQQILTVSVIRELGITLVQLWHYYLSIGGKANELQVNAYASGTGALPLEERDLLAWAVNEMVIDSPWLPRAPYSDTPLMLNPEGWGP